MENMFIYQRIKNIGYNFGILAPRRIMKFHLESL